MTREEYSTEIRRRLFVVNSLINKFDGDILKDLNLLPMQAKIIYLLAISNKEEIYQKDIDHCFSISHSTSSGILEKMEQLGIIYQYTCAGDKRKKIIKLTDKGFELYKEFEQKFDFLGEVFIYNISDAELETFLKILKKMNDNLKN